MNATTQRNKLEAQLKSFKDFVPFCPDDYLLKLMGEMAKIHFRIEKIKEYSTNKLAEDIAFYFETKQSKTNFKTI